MISTKRLRRRWLGARRPADTTTAVTPAQRHRFGKLSTVVGLTVIGLLAATATALAATGVIETGGPPLTERSGPGTSYAAVGALPSGIGVNIICQVPGDVVNGNWGPTNIWDELSDFNFVSDGFVYTGTNGIVQPC